MPIYEYVCEDCGKPFEIRASISDYSKGLDTPCPHCGSRKAIRVFSSVGMFTSGRGRGGGPPSGCGPMAGPGCCG
jgi:putative FmdB family regulatory protein